MRRSLLLVLLIAQDITPQCGSGTGPATTTDQNVQPIVVNTGPADEYLNGAFTSVTICVPGQSSNCQTIGGVLVDTGSSGLRVLSSALTLSLPQQTTNGNPVVECNQFVDGYTWGPVQTADIKLAGEQAGSVPIQVIGAPGFSTVPATCASSGPSEDTLDTLGANGVLGIGVFRQDCGIACAVGGLSNPGLYFSCPAAGCQSTIEPLTQQVQNPVWLFPTDNNGVLIQLPSVPSGGKPMSPARDGIRHRDAVEQCARRCEGPDDRRGGEFHDGVRGSVLRLELHRLGVERVFLSGFGDDRPRAVPGHVRLLLPGCIAESLGHQPRTNCWIGGFAVLLLLIIVLGNLSVRRLEDTSREALDVEHQHAAKTTLLQQLRVALTRLDNEARDRMEADARHELQPIFDLRLRTARGTVDDLVPLLDHLPLSELPKWRAFRGDLAAYVALTNDKTRYSQDGFAKFRDVDAELDDLVQESAAEQVQVVDHREALQRAATRSIRTWNLFAVLAGLLVAVATIWQVQRRFRQTRQSAEAARREREFSSQMLEGMVSAIAAIDRHDRIRSANTAFFSIFPEASIGVSIHNGIASPAGVKLLESVTASPVETATYRGRWNLTIDSGARTFDVYSSPLEIDSERGQILTLVDVTEAAKAEASLRQTESLTAVGEAAAQLAHEIKNPLGSIRLGVEMLREYAVSDDAVKTITLVERGIHHLNKLVVDVTQFSRRRQLERSEVDLQELLDSSIELVEDRVRKRKRRLSETIPRTRFAEVGMTSSCARSWSTCSETRSTPANRRRR